MHPGHYTADIMILRQNFGWLFGNELELNRSQEDEWVGILFCPTTVWAFSSPKSLELEDLCSALGIMHPQRRNPGIIHEVLFLGKTMCRRLWSTSCYFHHRKFMITWRAFALACILLEVNMMKMPVIQKPKLLQLDNSSLGYATVIRLDFPSVFNTSLLCFLVC